MKNLKLFGTIVEYVLLVFLIFLALIAFLPKLSFFSSRGVNFYAITSGSMEPTIKTGSLIYSGKFKPDELKKGDIITFKIVKDKAELVVTHRIVKIDAVESKVKIPKSSSKK